MSQMRIFLARHGQSVWNAEKRISGQGDPPLSELGLAQAKALARVLKNETLSAIYSSPLGRTIMTAQPTAEAQGLPLQTENALKEINLGSLQGRFRDERDPEAAQLWQAWQADKEQSPHGGESFLDLEARVMPCLETILQATEGGTVLIVGHRSTNRVLLGGLLGWSRSTYLSLGIRNRYLYDIELRPEPCISTLCLDAAKEGRRYAGFRT